jgi:hypothetical protein
MTFAFPEFMGLEIRKMISRSARSIGSCTSRVKMDLESRLLYLNKKDLAAIAIKHVLGESTVRYLPVTHHLRKQSFADSSTLPPEDREIRGPETIDNAILQALDEQPFASLRQIAKRILVPISIRHRLVSKMAYPLKYCR